GQPVREVEDAEASAWVKAAVFDCGAGRGKAEKTLKKCVNGDGAVSLAAPDRRAFETQFEVFRGPEADLLDMDPGVAGIIRVRQIRRGFGDIRRIGHKSVSVERAN